MLAFAAACAVPGAFAAEAKVEVPMRDPWVPPELAKQARVEPASSGAQLRQEVERKLRTRFEAAAGPGGLLTREGARAAGLGFIDRNFDAIDRRHAGRVGYADYRQFLRDRGAALE
jgi:hypothetical protein